MQKRTLLLSFVETMQESFEQVYHIPFKSMLGRVSDKGCYRVLSSGRKVQASFLVE